MKINVQPYENRWLCGAEIEQKRDTALLEWPEEPCFTLPKKARGLTTSGSLLLGQRNRVITYHGLHCTLLKELRKAARKPGPIPISDALFGTEEEITLTTECFKRVHSQYGIRELRRLLVHLQHLGWTIPDVATPRFVTVGGALHKAKYQGTIAIETDADVYLSDVAEHSDDWFTEDGLVAIPVCEGPTAALRDLVSRTESLARLIDSSESNCSEIVCTLRIDRVYVS